MKRSVAPRQDERTQEADAVRHHCRVVFLDETWVKTNMAPLRGWGMKGKRLAASVPYGHWMTMTFIAA